MKKFLMAAIILGILGFGFYYAAMYKGFYIDFYPDAPVVVGFAADGKKMIQYNGTEISEFTIQGVDVTASMPEHSATDFAADTSDYLRWFEAIGEMGANTIRALNIMDDDFYNALYTYNTSHEKPLYLLQAITLPDEVNYGGGDAWRDDYFGRFLSDGMKLVDIVHGRRILPKGQMSGSGSYRKDISPWVIGYLIGTEWNEDTIAYTNERKLYSGAYNGTYFSTGENATAFEAMLAEVMDRIMAYESKKYKEQRMIGFINEPLVDPFEYRDDYEEILYKFMRAELEWKTYARQLGKYSRLDAEHIKTENKNQAGTFAAYRLYDFCPEFYKYFSDEQKEALAEILTGLDTGRSYDGYLELLGQYHTMPVIGSFGFSTSRGIVSDAYGGPLDETAQGQRLVQVYDDMKHAGFSGGFVTGWQDQWELRSWNTAYAQDIANNKLWKDVQTDAQSYGLMEFTASEIQIDGDKSEWSEEDVVSSVDGIRLSVRVDGEGLCLLIEGENVSENQNLYIPIDTTQSSGSRMSLSPELNFSRAADFLLCLQGKTDSRLLVQARYESVRENFLNEMTGENPFEEYPEADSPEFIPIRMALENRIVLEKINYETYTKRYLPAWETGKLRHGNNHPDSEDYDSLADFCYGDRMVEVRLPWALLNVSNPVYMQIHEDYYKNYGVQSETIKKCYIGVGIGTEAEILMNAYTLDWKDPKYEERLKDSYWMLQSAWR